MYRSDPRRLLIGLAALALIFSVGFKFSPPSAPSSHFPQGPSTTVMAAGIHPEDVVGVAILIAGAVAGAWCAATDCL